MTHEAIVITDEITEVVVAEDPAAVVLSDTTEDVVVLDPPVEVVVIEDTTPDVVVVEEPTTEVIVIESGASQALITHLTEFIPEGMYVGTAPRGAVATDQAWQVYKIVEADDHELKIPAVAGLHTWDERTTLTYVAG